MIDATPHGTVQVPATAAAPHPPAPGKVTSWACKPAHDNTIIKKTQILPTFCKIIDCLLFSCEIRVLELSLSISSIKQKFGLRIFAQPNSDGNTQLSLLRWDNFQ
jgi:hypothetical protein